MEKPFEKLVRSLSITTLAGLDCPQHSYPVPLACAYRPVAGIGGMSGKLENEHDGPIKQAADVEWTAVRIGLSVLAVHIPSKLTDDTVNE